MKKFYTFPTFFCLPILFLIVGCINSNLTRDPDTLIYLLYNDVKDWDPASAFSMEVLPMSNIYEPLLWYDATGKDPKFIPALATSYSSSDDGLLWKFHIRDNVKFHDGSVCNAESVKLCIDRTKKIGEGPGFIWDAVERIEVVDDLTVVFHLKYPAPLDLIASAQYGAWIYSPVFLEMDRSDIRKGYASGTGPYRLSKWAQNQSILLKVNEEYWGEISDEVIRKIDIKIVSEAATRIQMIRGGDADICSLIPIEAVKSFENHPDLELKIFPSWINHLMIFNVKKPPTNNLKVRQAIAASMDYDNIINYIYNGMAEKPRGLIPNTLPGTLYPENMYRFDLNLAKDLLKEADLGEDESVRISYVASSNEYWKTCLMLQSNCNKVGLKTDLHAGLWSEIWSKGQRFESSSNMIEMAWWPAYATPSDWFLGMFATQNPPVFNLSYYSNSIVDSLIDRARELEAIDRKGSAKLYREIQTILLNDCVAIPIADVNSWIIAKNNLMGFRKNPAYNTVLFYYLRKIIS